MKVCSQGHILKISIGTCIWTKRALATVTMWTCEKCCSGIATVSAGTSQSARRTKWICLIEVWHKLNITTLKCFHSCWLAKGGGSIISSCAVFFLLLHGGFGNLGRTTAACRHCAAAIQTRKVCMPKSKSGFIHMGHMHITPHWQHDLRIKHQSAAIKLRSEARLTFHAKWSVRGMNAHLCFHEACAWWETSAEHIFQLTTNMLTDELKLRPARYFSPN